MEPSKAPAKSRDLAHVALSYAMCNLEIVLFVRINMYMVDFGFKEAACLRKAVEHMFQSPFSWEISLANMLKKFVVSHF